MDEGFRWHIKAVPVIWTGTTAIRVPQPLYYALDATSMPYLEPSALAASCLNSRAGKARLAALDAD